MRRGSGGSGWSVDISGMDRCFERMRRRCWGLNRFPNDSGVHPELTILRFPHIRSGSQILLLPFSANNPYESKHWTTSRHVKVPPVTIAVNYCRQVWSPPVGIAWCSTRSFQIGDTETIRAMVSDGRITTDILECRALISDQR